MLSGWEPGIVLRSTSPTYVLLWMRIRGIPIECFNQEAGWKFASIAGEPTEVRTGLRDARNLFYMRARVWVNLNAPLVLGFYLSLLDGGMIWVELEYERVHKICRRCGFIGHSLTTCRFANDEKALEELLIDHFEDMAHTLGVAL